MTGSISGVRGVSGTSGWTGSLSDENSINFNKSELPYALRIKEYIEALYDKKSNSQPIQNTGSVADELLKFKQLLDAGAITQEEFDNMKNNLLS